MDNVTIESNISFPKSGDNTEAVTFVADEEYALFSKVIVAVTLSLALFGVACNILNLRTFNRLGLKDGITVSLFTLSINDLCFVSLYVWLRSWTVVLILQQEGLLRMSIHPLVFQAHAAALTYVVSFIGMFAVTFLALARCLCVSMPLHFKHMFTKTRCVAFYIVFVVVCVGAFSWPLATIGVQTSRDPVTNETMTVLWLAPEREKVKDAVMLVFDTILLFICEVTLIVCVFVMAYKLRESSKFRLSHPGRNEGAVSAPDGMNNRARRVVIQVLLISVIYIAVNLPKMFNSLYMQLEPEFASGKRYQYVYYMIIDVRFFFECINSVVNFFVYYKFNSAFRASCFKRKSNARAESYNSSGHERNDMTTGTNHVNGNAA